MSNTYENPLSSDLILATCFVGHNVFQRVIMTTILIPVAVMQPQHSKFSVLDVALQGNEHKGEQVRTYTGINPISASLPKREFYTNPKWLAS